MSGPEILDSIAPFCEAGFAVHWLHPKSKRPIGDDWQKRPVATIEQLRETWRPGNNVGVRLGEPSILACGLYLHVIDLDIRIAELADEAWEAFAALFPTVDPLDLPLVASGSGGESRHIYLITDKPFFGKKLAVSEGKHRRFDADRKREVWSYDWEIELFGTGKQVAMPPSIHPDTGFPYEWAREFDFGLLAFGDGPYIPATDIEALGAAETATYEFEAREPLTFEPGQMERDLALLPTSRLDDYGDWVMLGQALHHQFGGSDEGYEIWIEQSKRSEKFALNDLREVRRKWRGFGRNRRQPVTMATIRQWAQDARSAAFLDAFEDEPEDDASHSDGPTVGNSIADPFGDLLAEPREPDEFDDLTEAAKPLDPAERALDWFSLLDFNEDNAIKPTLHNVELIVRNDIRLAGLAQINEFTQETVQRTPPGTKSKRRKNAAKDVRQLSGRVWEVKDTLNGELWSDDRDFAIRTILEAPKTQGGYGIKVTDRDLRAAIVLAANDHAFHPIREYLTSLTWDGQERIERLWIDYVYATDDCYHRDVARLVMVAAVTRIFEPGHKFDYATILEGLQGKRKSTLIEILGRKWFAELDGDFHDQKQMIELMQGAWIMEIPELTGFSRADVRSIKAFISRKRDRARLAYARRAGEFPRQCVFIGSTNDREYLKDDTGGRRFWPVQCNFDGEQEIDTDRLEAEVDQLWAEAVVLYRKMRAEKPTGTLPLYLRRAESRAIAARLQESRRVESPDDVLAGRIAEWLENPINSGGLEEETNEDGSPRYRNEVCTAMVWAECLNKDLANFKTVEQGQINRALSKVPGWEPDGSMRFPRYGKQRVFRRGGMIGKLERADLGEFLQ